MSRAAPHHRRQWVVHPAFQYRFIGILLILLLTLTGGALLSVYVAIWLTLHTFDLLQDPVALSQFTLTGLIATMELLIVAPFVIWIGVRWTHRVIGPLGRIQAALQQMGQGNFEVHLRLRKGDVLQELADRINALAATLRARSRQRSP